MQLFRIFVLQFVKMVTSNQVDEEPVSRTDSYKRVMKPLLERKRRARINRCLDELRDLLVNASSNDGDSVTRLEKADILELTVTHVRNLSHHRKLMLPSVNSNLTQERENTQSFLHGFNEAAHMVDNLLVNSCLSKETSDKLRQHLARVKFPAPSMSEPLPLSSVSRASHAPVAHIPSSLSNASSCQTPVFNTRQQNSISGAPVTHPLSTHPAQPVPHLPPTVARPIASLPVVASSMPRQAQSIPHQTRSPSNQNPTLPRIIPHLPNQTSSVSHLSSCTPPTVSVAGKIQSPGTLPQIKQENLSQARVSEEFKLPLRTQPQTCHIGKIMHSSKHRNNPYSVTQRHKVRNSDNFHLLRSNSPPPNNDFPTQPQTFPAYPSVNKPVTLSSVVVRDVDDSDRKVSPSPFIDVESLCEPESLLSSSSVFHPKARLPSSVVHGPPDARVEGQPALQGRHSPVEASGVVEQPEQMPVPQDLTKKIASSDPSWRPW